MRHPQHPSSTGQKLEEIREGLGATRYRFVKFHRNSGTPTIDDVARAAVYRTLLKKYLFLFLLNQLAPRRPGRPPVGGLLRSTVVWRIFSDGLERTFLPRANAEQLIEPSGHGDALTALIAVTATLTALHARHRPT